MDRCAVFVDAGYLIAEGAKAYVSPKAKRGDVAINYGELVSKLVARAEGESQLPLLRVYWYDGAAHGVPTMEQPGRPKIPASLDGELLRAVQTRVGDLRGRQEFRHAARDEFWRVVQLPED